MISPKEKKYNRLMEKAEELFTQLGYKAASMDQIAEAAGISKMTIYKYFPSKEELFLGVLQSITEKTYTELEERVKNVDGTLKKINVLISFSMEYSKQYSFVFYKDIMDNPYISQKLIQEKKKLSNKLFKDIIRNGINTGEIRNVDESFIANILMALIDGLANNISSKITCREELENFAEKFYDFLKYGLLGGKGDK